MSWLNMMENTNFYVKKNRLNAIILSLKKEFYIIQFLNLNLRKLVIKIKKQVLINKWKKDIIGSKII